MMRPMMVITTSISTRVKPCSLRRSLCCARNMETRPLLLCWRVSDFIMNLILALAHKLSDRQQRGHDRYDQSAHHRADGDDGERPDDAYDPVQAALQFRFVELGDPPRQRPQVAVFL